MQSGRIIIDKMMAFIVLKISTEWLVCDRINSNEKFSQNIALVKNEVTNTEKCGISKY